MKTLVTRHLSLVAAALAAASAGAAGFHADPVADYREGEFSAGIDADIVFVGGIAKEHVFSPKSKAAEYAEEMNAPYRNRRHQMSRIDWDVAAMMLGLKGSLRFGRLSLNGGVWYGGDSDDLEMEDFDWQEGDHVHYSDYSKSETELTDAWAFDANLSFDVWRDDAFVGHVFAGAREQRWKWTCDGRTDFWYSENDHVWTREKGHCCDYRQVILFGYAGVGGEWRLNDSLSLSAFLSWAPAYKGRDRDNHINGEKIVHDHFGWDGDVWTAGISLDWRMAERITVSFGLDWQKASINQGDLTQREFDSDQAEFHKDAAGIESECVSFTIGFRYAY